MSLNLIAPSLEFAFALKAELGSVVDSGSTPDGFRRIIEIRSGQFDGPRMKGTLLAGGADWQIIRTDRVTELHTHYILLTDDGVLIQVKVNGFDMHRETLWSGLQLAKRSTNRNTISEHLPSSTHRPDPMSG